MNSPARFQPMPLPLPTPTNLRSLLDAAGSLVPLQQIPGNPLGRARTYVVIYEQPQGAANYRVVRARSHARAESIAPDGIVMRRRPAWLSEEAVERASV